MTEGNEVECYRCGKRIERKVACFVQDNITGSRYRCEPLCEPGASAFPEKLNIRYLPGRESQLYVRADLVGECERCEGAEVSRFTPPEEGSDD